MRACQCGVKMAAYDSDAGYARLKGESDYGAEDETRHNRQHSEGCRADNRLAQVGRGEELLVLGQADKTCRAAEEVVGVEAQVDRADQRIEDPDREEQQRGRDEGKRRHHLAGSVARPAG